MNNETILSGKAGLTGIQWALQSRPARNILRGGLRQILDTDSQIGPFELTRAKFKLNSRLLAYYTFTVTVPGTEEARPVSMEVIWENPAKDRPDPGNDPKMLEMEEEASRNGLVKPFRQLQHAIPGRNVRLQIWPLDPDYPQLVRLGSPEYAPRLFEKAGIARKITEMGCVKITPIRYRPGERHVLRYQVDAPDLPSGQEKLYAKIYQDPKDAARAFRLANKVAGWLDDAAGAAEQPGGRSDGRPGERRPTDVRPRLLGNRPLGISEEDAVILYPHAAGIPLSQQLHRSPAWLSQQLRLVGSALARLHQGPESLVLELKENIIDKEIKVIARAYEHIQVLLPESGADVLRILERIQQLHDRLPKEKPTFTHSDFKADHLFISPAGITLIDFDTCALADPALDLGKFMADLEWWHEVHHIPGAGRSQQEFLQGYHETLRVSNQGGLDREASHGRLMRAKLYQSLILAKIAVRRTKLYQKDWATVMTRMVHRSEAILDELVAV